MQLNNENNNFLTFEPIKFSKTFRKVLSENSWKLKFPHTEVFEGRELMKINMESGLKYEIIRLSGDTQNNDNIRETVKLISEYVDLELGHNEFDVGKENRVIYLAIIKRVGVIAYLEVEPLDKAHKLIVRENDLPAASVEGFPVKMGVCKIWVHSGHRRIGIATHLMNVGRITFNDSVIIQRNDVAFIDLSYDGFEFAKSYMDGMDNINVYLLNPAVSE